MGLGNDVRWGILGCGDVTEVKSGPALQKAARSSVVAVMRRNGELAKDYAQRHNIAAWYDDADKLIADRNVNALYIATPPSSHLPLAEKAFAAGKPVFVEKPMAASLADCDQMNAAAVAADQPLVIAYYRRALPRFEKLRALIENGEIGQPLVANIVHFMPPNPLNSSDWRSDGSMGPGGMFFDVQSHTLDWLGYVFGPASDIKGLAVRQLPTAAAADFVGFSARFGEICVTATSSYAAQAAREEVTIYGDAGTLNMSFFAHTPITLTKNGDRQFFEIDDPVHVHQPLVERVIAHLLDGGPNPCSSDDGRRVNEIFAQIFGTEV